MTRTDAGQSADPPSTAQREPFLMWSSVLAGLYVLTGGAALSDLVGVKVAGMAVLVVAALQVTTSTYLRGKVTPTAAVIARWAPSGGAVAGPAAAKAGADEVGAVVDRAKRRALQ